MDNILLQSQTILQSTEAFPIEDRSLPADEVIEEQQHENLERPFPTIFVP
ncbi:MAG: hypothetical protein ACP5QU_05655 [Anaerolineae bacterium]